jgi:peroxiredoxin
MKALFLAGLFWGGVVLQAAALDVGQKAPDFALPGTPDKPLRLSQYSGKQVVVLHFYLGDFLAA